MERSPMPISSRNFTRSFSIDTASSSVENINSDLDKPDWKYLLTNPEFLIKIAQILVAITCACLYPEASKTMNHSITTVMYPIVVFVSFIIITSVIIISHVTGHAMPDLIVRIFNTLGCLLYFISALITFHAWYGVVRFTAISGIKLIRGNMLVAQVALSFFNSILYGTDVFLNIRQLWKELSY